MGEVFKEMYQNAVNLSSSLMSLHTQKALRITWETGALFLLKVEAEPQWAELTVAESLGFFIHTVE